MNGLRVGAYVEFVAYDRLRDHRGYYMWSERHHIGPDDAAIVLEFHPEDDTTMGSWVKLLILRTSVIGWSWRLYFRVVA